MDSMNSISLLVVLIGFILYSVVLVFVGVKLSKRCLFPKTEKEWIQEFVRVLSRTDVFPCVIHYYGSVRNSVVGLSILFQGKSPEEYVNVLKDELHLGNIEVLTLFWGCLVEFINRNKK